MASQPSNQKRVKVYFSPQYRVPNSTQWLRFALSAKDTQQEAEQFLQTRPMPSPDDVDVRIVKITEIRKTVFERTAQKRA